MEQIVNLVLLLLFIPGRVRELLLHASWWQVKEYRFDRFLVSLKTQTGREVLAPLTFWAKFVLLLSSPLVFQLSIYASYFILLAGLVFLIEDLIFAKELITKRLRRPDFTLRAQRILLTGLLVGAGALVLGYNVGLIRNYLSWLAFLLVLDKLLPISVPLGIIWTIPLVERTKRREVALAKQRLGRAKNLVSVSITGSYGKTSTKEFLAQILVAKFKVAKTTGSENTVFGIARKILANVTPATEVFVAEMGAYRKGEIQRLADIVQPKIGIITGIAPQHLELFGSFTNLMEAKYELIESLPSDGVAIFNGSNPYCRKLAQKTKKVKKLIYQVEKPKDDVENILWAEKIKVEKEKLSFWVYWKEKAQKFEVNLLGSHFVQNLLGATAAALFLGMSLSEIASAIAKIAYVEKTMEPKMSKTEALVIDDSYSTNPEGFEAALDYLSQVKFRKRFVVTPGIIELGEKSKEIHGKLGKTLAKVADRVFLTSSDAAKDIALGMGRYTGKLVIEKDVNKIFEELKRLAGNNDVILLEGRIPGTLRQKLIQS